MYSELNRTRVLWNPTYSVIVCICTRRAATLVNFFASSATSSKNKKHTNPWRLVSGLVLEYFPTFFKTKPPLTKIDNCLGTHFPVGTGQVVRGIFQLVFTVDCKSDSLFPLL